MSTAANTINVYYVLVAVGLFVCGFTVFVRGIFYTIRRSGDPIPFHRYYATALGMLIGGWIVGALGGTFFLILAFPVH